MSFRGTEKNTKTLEKKNEKILNYQRGGVGEPRGIYHFANCLFDKGKEQKNITEGDRGINKN